MTRSKAGGVEGLSPGDLRRFRQGLSMTQEKMARLVGVSYATISRWEAGRHRPSRLARERLKVLMEEEVRK